MNGEKKGELGGAYQFPPVRFPGRDLILTGHGQMDGVHHYTVPRGLCGSGWRGYAIRGIQ